MARRWIGLAAIYLSLILAGWSLGLWLEDLAIVEVLPQNESSVHGMIMFTLALYVVTSALPFVPGAEVGFALLMVFGAQIAFLVYTAMVSALVLAFLMGRLVPLPTAARFFNALGFRRAEALILRLSAMDPDQSLQFLMSTAPTRIVPTLLRFRYLSLILLLNIPGNSALGGGGGIAFIAGISRLFPFPWFVLSILIAVAPVPLYVVLTGYPG